MNSVCRRPSVDSKCAPKGSVKSVSSVRETTPQWVACMSSHRVGAFSFSQIYTEEQNTQGFTETLSQPISQNVTATFSLNVLWYLYAEGVLWVRNVGWNVLLNLWVLWEIKLPSDSQKCSFSHREHKRTEDTGLIERGLPSLDPNRSPLRVLLFKPTRHCLVVPSLSLQQVFSVVKNHYISPN